jgi:hypothetical protein
MLVLLLIERSTMFQLIIILSNSVSPDFAVTKAIGWLRIGKVGEEVTGSSDANWNQPGFTGDDRMTFRSIFFYPSTWWLNPAVFESPCAGMLVFEKSLIPLSSKLSEFASPPTIKLARLFHNGGFHT